MDQNKYREIGLPKKQSYRESVKYLTEQVCKIIEKRYNGYKHDNAFDALEQIIKDEIEANDQFDCSRENMEKKIMAVHDMDVPLFSLFVGPYPQYRRTVLEKLAEKLTAHIYRTGMKDEIIEAMFSVMIKEMKSRFGHRKSGYTFRGVEGRRNEGVIQKK